MSLYSKYGHLFDDDGFTEEYVDSTEHRFYEYGVDAGAFFHDGNRVWSCHYLCNSRGRKAMDATKAVLTDFFTNEDAVAVTGLIKDNNRPAKILTRKVGFTSLGKITYPEGDYELFILFKKDFMNG